MSTAVIWAACLTCLAAYGVLAMRNRSRRQAAVMRQQRAARLRAERVAAGMVPYHLENPGPPLCWEPGLDYLGWLETTTFARNGGSRER